MISPPILDKHLIKVRGNEIQKIKPGLTESNRKRLLTITSPIGIILIWETIVRIGLLNAQYIPAPSTIFGATIEAVQSGQLWGDLKISLFRIFLGFTLGAILGLIIGLGMGFLPIVRMFIDPIIATTYPIPKLAIMPLLMIILGMGETEKIVLIILGVIYPVCINTASGVLNLNKQYLDVAKNYGASKWDFYRTIAIPGALPVIFTGLKIGLAEALLLIVAAEMVGAQSGIGYRIWMSYEVYNMPMMFVSFMAMSILGYLFSSLMDELENWIVPWKH